jgi:hypothetical protein
MKPKRKKRKVAVPTKRPARKAVRVKVAPRKKRKAKMTSKKPIEDEEPRAAPKTPEPKPTETSKDDPMAQPPDSPVNPNLPPEQPTK